MLDVPPLLHETLAGRYVLKREIGRGGAALVYLAHDVRHERLVAIKVLHRELSHALGAQRFLREIKLTASLQHPHILPIHDSGEAHDQLYYVMPYVEGDSLRQRLGADSRLSLEEAVRVGREVAGALAYAHERGIVHRDIKPENILFSGGHAILADFGIARAINRAHEKITQQGTITGTPAYMSPEQARDRAFDGRSDVYSLACVLYESIAGVPPYVGETPQQLLTQRISKPAPPLREYRHDVPTQIEAVIAKALSISPDDRFDDARAFSAALSAAVGHSGETLTARTARRSIARSPWAWTAAVALLMTGAAASTRQGRDQIDLLAGRVDTAQYAIVPFQYIGGAAPADDQEPVAQGLYVAMREWAGLKLASDLSVNDQLRHSDGETLNDASTVARRVHAGKLIWGRVWVTRDSFKVRAAVYDAIGGASFREHTIGGPRDLLTQQPGILRTLAASLLRLDGTPAAALSGEAGTRNLVAWRAYQEAHRELATWRVPYAIAALERATLADPDYAHAHVWLAQLQLWRAEPVAKWAPHVNTALRYRAALGNREIALLDALHAIQNNLFGDACKAYNILRVQDSLDAAAWLGLTHCQAFDRMVVRDARSATGWSFRGSIAGAQRTYVRALQIAPSSFCALPFNSVQRRVFAIETAQYRSGADASGAEFFGKPNIVGDSIAYAARPISEILARGYSELAPFIDKAVQRNRETLLAAISALTLRMPDNPDVFEALSRTLESRDEITGTPNGGHSALSALERALVLATDTIQRARLGSADVRLHLKLGDFSRAQAIGDSILSSNAAATGKASEQLAGIAALLGREQLAIRHLRSAGRSVTLAGAPTVPLLEDVSTAFFVRASFGVCDDSLRALRARVETLLESYVNASQRDAARTGMIQRPLQFALACFGAAPTTGLVGQVGTAFQAAQALGRGDSTRARQLLDSGQAQRTLIRPGDYSLDYTVTEAWLRAALRDTAAAVRQLDLTLTALPTLQYWVTYEPGMAAAVGRSMAMRAELASRRGDAVTAALWAGRVLTLWSHADPSLAPTLARMRELAAHRM
ncbi:MAG: serine/threonine-protein kinase [Gemmatimonadota bacterium]